MISRRKAAWRSLLALWPALLGVATAAEAIADDDASRLDRLMAGYVLNFTKFVEWPESLHNAEIVICVAGNPGLYSALRAGTSGAQVGTHHVTARLIDGETSAAGCHVLYIEHASALHVASVEPMLTVSDGGGFAHGGGTIELFTQQNRLRFIINLDNARRAGLRISSNLLQLAASVEGTEPR
jgi:hypothetical protein